MTLVIPSASALAEGPAGPQHRPAHCSVQHRDVAEACQQQVEPCSQIDRRLELEQRVLPVRAKSASTNLEGNLGERPAIPGATLHARRRDALDEVLEQLRRIT